MSAIEHDAIPLVLLRDRAGGNQWAHVHMVEPARERYPERWELIYRDDSAPVPVLLYRIRGNDVEKADLPALLALSGPHALGDGR
jgi:hypothetical protein